MKARHLVVDGSNIATEGRAKPSLKQLDEAVRAFLDEHPHDKLTVVVDATFEHRIEAAERKTYEDALTAGELITPPAGTVGRGDKFLLEIAEKVGATVLSNDSFQEFHGEYRWLFDEGRLVGGKPVPHVGWVFTMRTPVRGPRSRQSVRAAKGQTRKARPASEAPTPKKPTRTTRARGTAKSAKATKAGATGPSETRPMEDRGRRRGRGPSHPEPVNEALPFLEFITEHPVGTAVQGVVDSFASHGAYIRAGEARCYVPLKAMGDPPPRSAREVLSKGEERTFVVQALDAPRRGIDLALPGFEEIDAAEQARAAETAQAEEAPAPAGAAPTQREVTRVAAAKKAPGKKKAPSKKAPARKKTSTKKAPARRKAPAKKTTARRSTAKKSTAKKKSPARKATAKKAAKKKSTAKRSTAKKAAKKKSTAKRSTAKKKSTARKATKRSPAKKAR